MSQVPTSPEGFFRDYLPARVLKLKAALGDASSNFCIGFRIGAESRYWLKLSRGELEVSATDPGGLLLTVVVAPEDFEAIIVKGAERVSEDLPPEKQMLAARMLLLDRERAELVRSVKGSLGVVLQDGATTRRLSLTPSQLDLDSQKPSCEVSCSIQDFWALQSGAANAFELLMNSKLRLSGDVEVAMALSAIFSV